METFTESLRLTALLFALAAPVTLLAGPDDVAVQVNDATLTERAVAQFAEKAIGRNPANDVEREHVVNEMIGQELWAQQAVKQALDKDPDIQAWIANMRRTLLAAAAIERYQREHPIGDDKLKARYQALIGQSREMEYKARHILLKSREEAVAVISELDKGTDFAELAQQRSTGPSAARSGDLGWFSPKTMIKPFGDAVSTMKKASYSKEPLQTQFGWHVILLEDSRTRQPPAFEQVKPRLRQMMQQQAVGDRVLQLKEEARIEIK